MFDFLKGNKPTDIKGIRSAVLQFIKEQLQKAEGGEGANIRGLQLFVYCPEEEKHLYESALFSEEENRFKEEEVQKIADDYAIDLPEDWVFEIAYIDQPPADAVKAGNIAVALYVSTRKKHKVITEEVTAVLKVLVGETDREEYEVTPISGRVNIGREKKVQTADGFYRENLIAFVGTANESNKSVSRQHGHIEWDAEKGAFYLFADEGGIPPYNKMKVRSAGGTPVKLQTVEIGYRLNDGDQITLGDSAVLEFSLK